jgi:uncharacterized membrane-anchored protein YhcB (DUF1043 family)
MSILGTIAMSALGPVAAVGLKVVKSKHFAKALIVLALVAIVFFGIRSYRAMAAELAVTQADLSDTEEAWAQTQQEVEDANAESARVHLLLANVITDKAILKKHLGDRLRKIRDLEDSLGEKDEAFKQCLDVNIPADYLDSLFSTETN